MAKKAAAKAKKPTGAAAIKTVEDAPFNSAVKPSPGLGKKYCPHCDKIIAARSTTCPECGKAIAPKNAKAKKPVAKTAKGSIGVGNGQASALEVIKLAREFVAASGGTANAAEILLALGSTNHG